MIHVKALSLQACEFWAFDMHHWRVCKSTTMIDLHIFLIAARCFPRIYNFFLVAYAICRDILVTSIDNLLHFMRRLATFLLRETTNLEGLTTQGNKGWIVELHPYITCPLILCIKPKIWVIEIHLHLVIWVFYLAMLLLLLWSNKSLWRSHINQSSQNFEIRGLDKPCRKKTTMDNQVAHIRPLKTFYLITQTIPLGWRDSPIIGVLFFFPFQKYFTNHAQSLSYRYLLHIHGEPSLMCHSKVSKALWSIPWNGYHK